MEYYSAIKKNEIMPLAATWMDLKIILRSHSNYFQESKQLPNSSIIKLPDI